MQPKIQVWNGLYSLARATSDPTLEFQKYKISWNSYQLRYWQVFNKRSKFLLKIFRLRNVILVDNEVFWEFIRPSLGIWIDGCKIFYYPLRVSIDGWKLPNGPIISKNRWVQSVLFQNQRMQLHPLTHSNDAPDIFDGMSLFSRMVKGKILTNFVSD